MGLSLRSDSEFPCQRSKTAHPHLPRLPPVGTGRDQYQLEVLTDNSLPGGSRNKVFEVINGAVVDSGLPVVIMDRAIAMWRLLNMCHLRGFIAFHGMWAVSLWVHVHAEV